MWCMRRALIRLGLILGLLSQQAWLTAAASDNTRVRFDIPDRIECADITPERCANACPLLKVVEGKFRVSASFIEGGEANVVDFDYLISSPGLRLKVLDFLPNTTLESTYADDRIEVADLTETSSTTSAEARVSYAIASLNAAKNSTAKRTEENRYQRIAAKSLVLASGTINRGHGVFYKLRPSNAASLEGAKEFTFLAVVPKAWRGDWCTFVCIARANKKSLLSSSVTLAGVEQAHVGLYLRGDHEAADLATRLSVVQLQNDGALAKQFALEASKAAEAMHAATSTSRPFHQIDDLFAQLVPFRGDNKSTTRQLEDARRGIQEIEQRLAGLSAVSLPTATAPLTSPTTAGTTPAVSR